MVWKRFIFSCVYFLVEVYLMSPHYLLITKMVSVFIMCCVVATVLFLMGLWQELVMFSPAWGGGGQWCHSFPPAQPCLPGREGERWPWDGRVSSTEQELQLRSAKVMQNWNTLVKLKFVLIPLVGNTVNENRSNQIKIIYFISLQHCKTFQGSTALWYKPEIDAVPLFTSKTTKVKTFKCIKAILLIVSTEDSPLPFLVKYS